MARQVGALQYLGTIGNIRNFKIRGLDGIYAGLIGGATRDQILTDPAFARTRENMSEFGGSAQMGKALRDAVPSLVRTHADTIFAGRLTAKFRSLADFGTGVRGQRDINLYNNPQVLQGLPLNPKQPLRTVGGFPFTLSINSGRNLCDINVLGFTPRDVLDVPVGATHFRVVLAIASVSTRQYNTSTKKYEPVNPQNDSLGEVVYSAYTSVDAPVSSLAASAALPGSPVMTTDEALCTFVGIEFYQLVNATQYLFAQNNATDIVDVR